MPQDPKIREILGFGGSEQRPEDKLVTVVYGPDLVNISFLNFMAVVQDDTAKVGQQRCQGHSTRQGVTHRVWGANRVAGIAGE